MSEQRTSKVSIVGVGSVGTAIAYACMIRGSAGAIALYDMAAKKVHAEVLDLNHGSQFVPNCVVTGSDSMDVTAGSSVVIVTAGAAQKPGQTRLELAATNVGIVQTMMPQLLEHSPNAIFIFVTNPVDIVTLAAARSVDIDPGRIFGSGTVLDSSRFRYLIAQRAGVDVGNVHGVIVGEHRRLPTQRRRAGVAHPGLAVRCRPGAGGAAIGQRAAGTSEFGQNARRYPRFAEAVALAPA